VEDERDALGRRQLGHHDVEGEPDFVVQGDAVGGVHLRRRTRFERVLRCGAAPLPVRRTEPIEAEAGHDDREPAAQIVDLVEVLVDEPGEGLLHRVLGLADAAEHPEGDVEQVTVVVAEGATETRVGLAGIAHVGPPGCRFPPSHDHYDERATGM
jgi:hypothetical protein